MKVRGQIRTNPTTEVQKLGKSQGFFSTKEIIDESTQDTKSKVCNHDCTHCKIKDISNIVLETF